MRQVEKRFKELNIFKGKVLQTFYEHKRDADMDYERQIPHIIKDYRRVPVQTREIKFDENGRMKLKPDLPNLNNESSDSEEVPFQ